MDVDVVYNEDCLIGMKALPDQSINAIITDLPYGTTMNKWDTIIPLDSLWEQYSRIIKPNGAIVLFAQSPFDKVLGCSNLKWLRYEWIWQKSNSTGFLNAKNAPMKAHETILVFSPAGASPSAKPPMVYNPQFFMSKPYVAVRKGLKPSENYGKYDGTTTVSNGERYPIDVIQFPSERNTKHPTEKPLKLIRYLVRTYSNEGELILDSCMGSGTTALAAIQENRHFIGYETNKEYYDLIIDRIKKERSQQRLFFS